MALPTRRCSDFRMNITQTRPKLTARTSVPRARRSLEPTRWPLDCGDQIARYAAMGRRAAGHGDRVAAGDLSRDAVARGGCARRVLVHHDLRERPPGAALASRVRADPDHHGARL